MKKSQRRRTLVIFSLIISVLATTLCSCQKTSATIQNPVDSSKIGKIKTVLILGNSIVIHPPAPDIGWYGDWGMAASIRDSDFVHILIHDIRQEDSSVVIRFENISNFEKYFTSYPLSNLDSLKNPDMIVLRIAENVDDTKAADSNFIFYYDRLVRYVDPNNTAVRIITDGFWEKTIVNSEIKTYAMDSEYPFISITDLSGDASNEAGNKFGNPGVAMHPSDKGMRMMAQRIWAYMKIYF